MTLKIIRNGEQVEEVDVFNFVNVPNIIVHTDKGENAYRIYTDRTELHLYTGVDEEVRVHVVTD